MGAVTCWTGHNTDVIASIDGGPMGDVGIDRLRMGLSISPGTTTAPVYGSLDLPVNDRIGYGGRVTLR